MPSPIILIGFMGVGKSAVGDRLAQIKGGLWVDTDAVVAAKHGPIGDIFNNEGESGFRAIELRAFTNACRQHPLVISTGGGMVTHAPSYRVLLGMDRVVWLMASLNTVMARIQADSTNERPLADNDISDRFLQRQAMYRACSDMAIEVTNRTVEEVAQIIINRYG